jgi:hypothetical protein
MEPTVKAFTLPGEVISCGFVFDDVGHFKAFFETKMSGSVIFSGRQEGDLVSNWHPNGFVLIMCI